MSSILENAKDLGQGVYTQAEIDSAIGSAAAIAESNAIQANRGFKNYIINGGFDIWQRGTSFNNLTDRTYFADRWQVYSDINNFENLQLIEGSGYTYQNRALAWNKNNASQEYIIQRVEDLRRFKGKTVTLSFYFHNDGTAPVTLYTGVSFLYGTGGSAPIYEPMNQSVLVEAGTNGVYDFTFVLDTATYFSGKTFSTFDSSLELIIKTVDNPVGTMYVDNVQLEEGSVATPFEQRPYGLELSLCQRYYEVGQVSARFYSTAGLFLQNTHCSFKVPKFKINSFSIIDGGARNNLNAVASAVNSLLDGFRFEIISQNAGDTYALHDNYIYDGEL